LTISEETPEVAMELMTEDAEVCIIFVSRFLWSGYRISYWWDCSVANVLTSQLPLLYHICIIYAMTYPACW